MFYAIGIPVQYFEKQGAEPRAALITHVHAGPVVNLVVFNHDGSSFPALTVWDGDTADRSPDQHFFFNIPAPPVPADAKAVDQSTEVPQPYEAV